MEPLPEDDGIEPEQIRVEAEGSTTWPVNGGKMGARIRHKNWSETPLGPMSEWPIGLRTAVELCLSANTPISIYGGSEFILIYNDAWSRLIGKRHPEVLGQPARTAFPENWDNVESDCLSMVAMGVVANSSAAVPPSSELNKIQLGSSEEECTSIADKILCDQLSPIRNGDGEVIGIINMVSEADEHPQNDLTSERDRRHLHQAIDVLPTPVYKTDADGRLTYFNEAAKELCGREPRIGEDQWCVSFKMYHADGSPMAHKDSPLARVLRGEMNTDGEIIVAERPDGKQIWLEAYPSALRDADDNIVGGINMLVDITERRQRQQLMRAQKQLMELIASGSPLEECLIALCKAVNRINPDARAAVLLTNDEGTVFERVLAPDLPSSFVEAVEGTAVHEPARCTCDLAIRTGEAVVSIDLRSDERWDQSWREWVIDHGIRACTSGPIINNHGSVFGSLMIYFSEVHEPDEWDYRLSESARYVACIAVERDRASRELAKITAESNRQKRLYEAIFSSTPDLVYVLDVDYRFVFANDALLEMWGTTLEEAVGKSFPDLGYEPWHTEMHEREIDKVVATRQPVRGEVPFPHATLGKRYYDYIFVPVVNAEGEVEAIAGTTRDVTERRKAENALMELTASLEERVRERTKTVKKLASKLTMAEQEERRRISRTLHDDLQQLLYGIQLKMCFVRKEAEGADNDGLVEQTREAEALLDDAISTTRQLTVDLSPPVLKGEGLADMLQWLQSQMNDLHGLEVDVKSEVAFRIENEDMRVLFFQIIRELLFNVVKHADTRRATVHLYKENDQLIICVEDDGCGFNPELAANDREDNFGLFSVRERLDLFGGKIEIDSAPGQGTKVTVHTNVAPK